MKTWIQELMTKDLGYGLQGYELFVIGGLAFLVALLARLAYRYFRGDSDQVNQ